MSGTHVCMSYKDSFMHLTNVSSVLSTLLELGPPRIGHGPCSPNALRSWGTRGVLGHSDTASVS